LKSLIPVDKKIFISLYFDTSSNIGRFDTSPEGILKDFTPKDKRFLKDSILKIEQRNFIFFVLYI
tara:strand:- start:258 stop:452 length:195 start_codon:yes stop_codon:yes gene_type:complete